MIFLLWIGIIALGLYLMISISTTWLQPFFIFRPEQLDEDYEFSFQKNLEEVWINTPKGGRIHALWRKVESSKGVVLYFHGNAGSLKRWGHLYHFFERHQYDLFIMDYRGFGKSKGKQSMSAMYQDAEAAYEFIRNHYDADRIILYGRSLGASFALHVTVRAQAKLLVLETPFSSMEDLFYAYFPFLPKIFPFSFKLQNRRNLEKAPCPVYLFHGTADWVVPYRVASKLMPYLKDNDRFFTITGGGHNDLLYFDLYQEEMAWILKIRDTN